MTRDELIEFCLTLPHAYEDYPFADMAGGGDVCTARHRGNAKIFALITGDGTDCIVNLKCDPEEALALREAYTAVTPGYHMNKRHWNSVALAGDVDDEELENMVSDSYDLVRPKRGM